MVALRTSYARINRVSRAAVLRAHFSTSRAVLAAARRASCALARPATRATRGVRAAAHAHVSSSHGQPFARAHCRTRRWPPSAACQHVSSSHGQPFARPLQHLEPPAADAHADSSHGQPLPRAHLSTLRWPPPPRTCRRTPVQVTPLKKIPQRCQASKLRGEPCISQVLYRASTASRIERLTARRRARSFTSARPRI